VAHAGYLLIGLRAAAISPIPATSALAYYLLAYTFTVLGAFGVVVGIERIIGREPTLDDLAGFSRRHPALAAALALFMLTLAGVPPTAGFTAKLVVFGAAVRAGDYGLAVLGVLASAVSLYYYLRVVVVMYMREPEGSAVETPGRFPSVGGVVAVAAAAVLVLGVGPWYLTTTDAVGGAAGAHLASP